MRLFGHLNVSRLNMSANADAQVILFPAGIVAWHFRLYLEMADKAAARDIRVATRPGLIGSPTPEFGMRA